MNKIIIGIKIGGTMFDQDDIFSSLSFDEPVYFDDRMPLIYDDPNILEGVES